MHSCRSPPDMICRTLPLGILTKNPPYFLTGESFHLGTTVVLLRGGPLFWHVIQFHRHQPASRLRSTIILLHQNLISSSLEHVQQIFSLHSSYFQQFQTIAFLCYSFVYTLNINNNNHYTIIRQIFKSRLLCSNAQRLHTRLTELD